MLPRQTKRTDEGGGDAAAVFVVVPFAVATPSCAAILPGMSDRWNGTLYVRNIPSINSSLRDGVTVIMNVWNRKRLAFRVAVAWP